MFTNLFIEVAENDMREDGVTYVSEKLSYLYQTSDNHTAVKILRNINDKVFRYRLIGPTANLIKKYGE